MNTSLSNELIFTLKPHLAVLSCDVSHLHPELGRIVQTFKQEEDTFPFIGDLKLFLSAWAIFAKDSDTPGNFGHLDSRIKERIWSEVFALKNLYLAHQIPDIIKAEVKHPFSAEKRIERYRERLDLTNYDIWPDNSTIWLARKGL